MNKPSEPLLHGGKVVSNTRLAITMGAAMAVSPLAIDMYLPSLPTLAQEFQVDMSRVQVTLSSFFLGIALFQVVYGPLSDRFGRRRPLLVGLVIYALASAMCAFSTSVEMLTVGRFFQAMGSCAGMVISMAVVRDRFSPVEGAHMMSRMILVMGVAPILAPSFGGFLLTTLGWQAIFGVLAIYGAVLAAAIALYLPETRPAHYKGPSNPWQALKVYGGLFLHRRYMGYALTRSLVQGALFAYITGSPFVFIELHGVPTKYFGILFSLNALGIIGGAQVNQRLLRNRSPEKVLRGALVAVGISTMALVGAALLPLSLGTTGFVLLLIPLFCQIAGSGLVQPNSVVLALAPFGDRAGSASALMGSIMFALASLASSAVALFHTHSALPMAGTMATCAVLGICAYYFLARARPGEAPVSTGH